MFVALVVAGFDVTSLRSVPVTGGGPDADRAVHRVHSAIVGRPCLATSTPLHANSGKTGFGNKMVLVGVVTFVATLLVLLAICKFVM